MNWLNIIRPRAVLLLFPLGLNAQTPEWIWHDNHGVPPADNEVRYFRKTFAVDGTVRRAVLALAGDDQAVAFLNGKRVAISRGWEHATRANVRQAIVSGANLLAIRGKNNSGDAALIARLDLTFDSGKTETIVTDPSWVSSATPADGWEKPGFDAPGWTKAVSHGKLGIAPYGDVMAAPLATAAEKLTVPPGFKVELLRSAQPGEGSWICMTIDPKGRLIISPQERGAPLLRVTLSPKGQVAKIQPLTAPVGIAMGLLYAFDSLYVSGLGPEGDGVYRLRDTKGTDQFDEVTLLKKWDGGMGEHGAHAIVLGPDKMLYLVNGNFTHIPKDISPDSPHKHYAEDQLLPREEDGNGFGVGLKPPGGQVLRMDPEGKSWELWASGMRNTYDIAFNTDGELFGFDSDMEWDWGMPWYRPIRIIHLVSAGDYGFREGTGKWPPYYPDSLPPAVNVGIGSPTGLKFGTDSKFPPAYRQALFAMDWAYGRLFAVHFKPEGATYSATFETFLEGKPLNLTDLEFGHDGAMYFITGGRGTQSGLYRVSYVGPRVRQPALTAEEKQELKTAAAARAARHRLEKFQGHEDPAAVNFAWPYLDSPDRWMRYAARIAIESQPVEQWQQRALDETRTEASITALLALARLGSASQEPQLLQALGRLSPDQLTVDQKLEALRVVELAFIRMGHPDADTAQSVINALDPLYPAPETRINHELCQLLIYLEAPDVVSKTLALLDAAPTQEEQIYYVFRLRTLKTGWTLDQRRHYFSWFNQSHAGLQHPADLVAWFKTTGQDYHDGASFPRFMANIRKDAVAALTDADRAELAPLITGQQTAVAPAPTQTRKFVREWKMEDLLPAIDQVSKGRSFERGKEVFAAAQCMQCHRFGNEGGAVGPDLTAVASRFTVRDILDSIIEPSKVISEQYQNMTLTLKDGDEVTGRIVEEDNQKVVLVTDALKQTKTEVKRSDVVSRRASKVSPMPEGLLVIFNKDEILDLLAYLESGGKPDAPMFRAAK
ncbi:MAG: c-type cytochrome [Verrucomicrobia bacterium]|nr:c-type cytochrome [Verrucomicrobiota bacterium]